MANKRRLQKEKRTKKINGQRGGYGVFLVRQSYLRSQSFRSQLAVVEAPPGHPSDVIGNSNAFTQLSLLLIICARASASATSSST